MQAVPAANGRDLEWTWEDTSHTGVYRLVVSAIDGQTHFIDQGVNVDPRESRLSSCREEDLRQSAPGVSFHYLEQVDPDGDDDSEHRREYWRALLLAALLTLLLEQTLACRFGHST